MKLLTGFIGCTGAESRYLEARILYEIAVGGAGTSAQLTAAIARDGPALGVNKARVYQRLLRMKHRGLVVPVCLHMKANRAAAKTAWRLP